MKKTQKSFVLEQLHDYGEISRNQCLAHFISRLSAIIQNLEVEGYVFKTEWRGGDFVYMLADKPKKLPIVHPTFVERDGQMVAHYGH